MLLISIAISTNSSYYEKLLLAPVGGLFRLLKGLIFFTKPLMLGIGASKVLPEKGTRTILASLLLLIHDMINSKYD